MTRKFQILKCRYHIQYIKYVQQKMSPCLGIIGSFLGSQLPQKISKREEEILFFLIIIKGLIQKMVNVFVTLVAIHVHVHPVFLNLINIGYQVVLYNINQGMPLLKIDTITKSLNITMIVSSWNS